MKKLLVGLLITTTFVGCGNTGTAISLAEAEKIALKEVNGELIHSSQETDDGRVYFDIDILKDGTLHELELNAKGKIRSHEQEKNYSNSYSVSGTNSSTTAAADTTTAPANANASNVAKITAEQANNIALERVGGGTVTKNELDYDDGILRYEVEIINGYMEYDLKVDAKTGTIIAFDQDTI